MHRPHEYTIGEIIRDQREMTGLTQKELAAKVDINRSTLLSYELGRKLPSPENLLKIAKMTGWDFIEAKKQLYRELTARYEKRLRKKMGI